MFVSNSPLSTLTEKIYGYIFCIMIVVLSALVSIASDHKVANVKRGENNNKNSRCWNLILILGGTSILLILLFTTSQQMNIYTYQQHQPN